MGGWLSNVGDRRRPLARDWSEADRLEPDRRTCGSTRSTSGDGLTVCREGRRTRAPNIAHPAARDTQIGVGERPRVEITATSRSDRRVDSDIDCETSATERVQERRAALVQRQVGVTAAALAVLDAGKERTKTFCDVGIRQVDLDVTRNEAAHVCELRFAARDVLHGGDPCLVDLLPPNRRFAFEEPWPFTATAPIPDSMVEWFTAIGVPLSEVYDDLSSVTPIATEFLIESASGGSCVIRVVTSAYGRGADWENEFFAEMVAGLVELLDNLATHFDDRHGASR